jgi:uncharacterized protein (DUF2141 family)
MNCFLILIMLASCWTEPPVLNVEITGIKDIQGKIMVAVYDSGEEFLGHNAVASAILEVTGETVRGGVEIPYGTYGISVFHDLDSNGELNTNLFGIPKEPIGFSNNSQGTFGPPSFKAASFDFSLDKQTMKIEIQ